MIERAGCGAGGWGRQLLEEAKVKKHETKAGLRPLRHCLRSLFLVIFKFLLEYCTSVINPAFRAI